MDCLHGIVSITCTLIILLLIVWNTLALCIHAPVQSPLIITCTQLKNHLEMPLLVGPHPNHALLLICLEFCWEKQLYTPVLLTMLMHVHVYVHVHVCSWCYTLYLLYAEMRSILHLLECKRENKGIHVHVHVFVLFLCAFSLLYRQKICLCVTKMERTFQFHQKGTCRGYEALNL